MAVNLAEVIEQAFSGIEAVERVYVTRDGSQLRIFTVIDEDDEAVHSHMYRREKELRNALSGVPVRFNVIARRDRRVEEILGDRQPVWQRAAINQSCDNVTNI